MRIRVNGLSIAEVDDRQQRDDCRAHRHNVVHAQHAQRNQQRECRFGSICGRTQCIQPEDGNAGNGANMLGALFAGSERPSKK